jgi:hypothetical protein
MLHPSAGADNFATAKAVPDNSAPAAEYWTEYSEKTFTMMSFQELGLLPLDSQHKLHFACRLHFGFSE